MDGLVSCTNTSVVFARGMFAEKTTPTSIQRPVTHTYAHDNVNVATTAYQCIVSPRGFFLGCVIPYLDSRNLGEAFMGDSLCRMPQAGQDLGPPPHNSLTLPFQVPAPNDVGLTE